MCPQVGEAEEDTGNYPDELKRPVEFESHRVHLSTVISKAHVAWNWTQHCLSGKSWGPTVCFGVPASEIEAMAGPSPWASTPKSARLTVALMIFVGVAWDMARSCADAGYGQIW